MSCGSASSCLKHCGRYGAATERERGRGALWKVRRSGKLSPSGVCAATHPLPRCARREILLRVRWCPFWLFSNDGYIGCCRALALSQLLRTFHSAPLSLSLPYLWQCFRHAVALPQAHLSRARRTVHIGRCYCSPKLGFLGQYSTNLDQVCCKILISKRSI